MIKNKIDMIRAVLYVLMLALPCLLIPVPLLGVIYMCSGPVIAGILAIPLYILEMIILVRKN